MRKAITIRLPYKFIPRPYQEEVLRVLQTGVKRVVLVWHRRAGKDLLAFNIAIREMMRKKAVCYYVFPTYAQGKKVIWDTITDDGLHFIDHIPKELIDTISETEMKITLYNGSIIQIVGADNVDSLVGTNPSLCIFSEYAIQKEEVWEFLRPILAQNGGTAIFMFTPRGHNHAWYFLKKAERSADWYTSVLTVDDTRAIPETEIRKEKAEMPEDTFLQEYYCTFTQGDAQVFRRVHEAVHKENNQLAPEPGKRYVLGCDIAKRQDYTVITPVDLFTFRVGKQIVLKTMDYPQQEAYIEAEYQRWNRPRVRIDSTGVGEALCDYLEKKIKAERFYFTQQTRDELLENLKILIEKGKITLPDDRMLVDQLMAFQFVDIGRGRNRMEVPSGMKDDLVMSLALAVWGLPERPLRVRADQKEEIKILAQFDALKGKPSSYLRRAVAMGRYLEKNVISKMDAQ